MDGTRVHRAKPDPEVFLTGAGDLKLAPENCVVFEDAAAGIEAAHRGGMHAVGIGDPGILSAADVVLPGFAGVTVQQVLDKLGLE